MQYGVEEWVEQDPKIDLIDVSEKLLDSVVTSAIMQEQEFDLCRSYERRDLQATVPQYADINSDVGRTARIDAGLSFPACLWIQTHMQEQHAPGLDELACRLLNLSTTDRCIFVLCHCCSSTASSAACRTN